MSGGSTGRDAEVSFPLTDSALPSHLSPMGRGIREGHRTVLLPIGEKVARPKGEPDEGVIQ